MSRYLFAMLEGGGTVPPELGLARRLRARGHAVRVIGDPILEAAAREVGCGFTAWRDAPHVKSLRPEHALVRDWEMTSPLATFAAARDDVLCGPALRFAREVLAELDQHPADALVADMMVLGAALAGEKARLPTAILFPNLYPFPTRGRPMLGTGLAPAQGVLDRLRDALMARVFHAVFDRGVRALNEARRALALAPIAHTFDLLERVRRLLVLSSESFDFPGPPFPDNVRFVGAQLDDPYWAAPWESPWAADDQRPLVLVALSSTYQNQLATLRRIASALGHRPLRVLLTKGPALEGLELRAADNVCVVDAAPHARILPDAAALVSHCGHGTVMKALAAGVPIIGMPMGRDQGDNAARIAYHGAGIRLRRSAPADQIRAAVLRVIAEPSYRMEAARLGRVIRGEIAEDRAMVELEALPAPSHRTLAGAAVS